jgi:hypothetical protein
MGCVIISLGKIIWRYFSSPFSTSKHIFRFTPSSRSHIIIYNSPTCSPTFHGYTRCHFTSSPDRAVMYTPERINCDMTAAIASHGHLDRVSIHERKLQLSIDLSTRYQDLGGCLVHQNTPCSARCHPCGPCLLLPRWIHSHYLRHETRSMYEHTLRTGAQYPMIEASAECTLIRFISPRAGDYKIPFPR